VAVGGGVPIAPPINAEGGAGRSEFLQTLFLDRADPHQSQVRAGRGRIPQAPSLFFKEMQIVRGCDVKRNVLIEDSLCS
jgi:hypothetical protein